MMLNKHVWKVVGNLPSLFGRIQQGRRPFFLLHWVFISVLRLFLVMSRWLWHMGLDVLQCGDSSQTRNGTCVPCIGRQIRNHWTTEEIQWLCFNWIIFSPETS